MEEVKQFLYCNVGEQIRKAREYAGMTQEELAERVKLPQQGISRFETAERDPSISNLEKMAYAMGMTIEINFVPRT